MKPFFSLRFLVPFLLLLLFGWAVKDAPFASIWETLRSLKLYQVLALAALNTLIVVLFSSRWWLILRAQGSRVPYFSLVRYRLAGFAISYFTPGTQFGGEPLQVYLLQQRHELQSATAVAAVTLDKLFEVLANFTFLFAGVLLVLSTNLLPGMARGEMLLGSGLLLAAPLAYLLILWAGRLPLTWLVLHAPGWLVRRRFWDKASSFVAPMERQISGLFHLHPLIILGIVFLSGLLWILMVVEYWLTLRFLGAVLDPFQAVGALTAARLAFLAPLPAGLGALEASQVFAMQTLGYDAALGISLSLLIRLRDLCFGLLGLWWAGSLTHSKTARGRASQAAERGPGALQPSNLKRTEG